MTQPHLNRRNILKGSLAVLAGSTATLLGSVVHAQMVVGKPQKWDESTDIIVVGSGFAGLAAAIEAADAGAKVMVLEKMPTIGGNSIINGGDIVVIGGPHQKAAGIKGDSEDILEADMLRNGLYLNDPARVKLVSHSTLSNYNWLVDVLGVEFSDGVGLTGGHSFNRCVSAKNGSGSAYVMKEAEYLDKKHGIKPRTRVYVENIIRDPETGRVVGLKVREGYRFPKEGSGKVKYIEAKKAVVLCHGGFGADVKYRSMLDPKLTATFQTTNQPGATAELWREAARIGANIIQADWIQCTPWNNPLEKGMGIGWIFSSDVCGESGLWVNTNGKRFVDETTNRKIAADAILVEQGKGLHAVAIANEDSWKVNSVLKRKPTYRDTVLKANLVKKYDTLEALARDWNIPLDALKAEIAEFNQFVKAGKDSKFNRNFTPNTIVLNDGPWYAAEMSPKIHHTMGGIKTTLDGEALDISTDKPIPGLFAAGECCGGTHGAVRMGDNGTLDALVTGRIAGRNAAKAQ